MQKFPLKKGLSNVEDLHAEINEYIDEMCETYFSLNSDNEISDYEW